MLEKLRNPKLIAILPVLFVALAAPMFAPAAHAYGQPNWQTAFSGTFITPGGGNSGFWGWCAFAGGTGSPAISGNSADCEMDNYAPGHQFQLHQSISGTAWSLGPCTVPPCINPTDFYITAGTMTLSGPSAAGIISIGGPLLLQAGCTIKGDTVNCPLSVWEVVPPGCVPGQPGQCLYTPDTGIPAQAGHYNLNSLINHPGELQVQVVQLG